MAKWINDTAMDTCLGWIKDNISKSIACSAQPADGTEATSTYDLSTSAITSANVTGPADGASGRKITIDALTEQTIQHSGDATHFALTRVLPTTLVGCVELGVANTGTASSATTVSCTPPLPEGVLSGDTIIVVGWSTSNSGSNQVTACGTGYTTEVLDYLSTTRYHMTVFSKIAGSSEADPVLTQTSDTTATTLTVYGRVWVFRESGSGLGVTVGTRAEVDNDNITYPGITTTQNNAMVLAISVGFQPMEHLEALTNANITFTESEAADTFIHLHYGTMETAGATGDTTGLVDGAAPLGMYCHIELDIDDDELSFVTTCDTTTLDSAVKLSVGAWDIQISDPV